MQKQNFEHFFDSLRYFSLRNKLYSTATIVATTYIIFHLILLIFSNDIKTKWDTYESQISKKTQIISQVRSHMGYGGMIHAYKDYQLQKKNNRNNKLKCLCFLFLFF
jgi:hypothetical protein